MPLYLHKNNNLFYIISNIPRKILNQFIYGKSVTSIPLGHKNIDTINTAIFKRGKIQLFNEKQTVRSWTHHHNNYDIDWEQNITTNQIQYESSGRA